MKKEKKLTKEKVNEKLFDRIELSLLTIIFLSLCFHILFLSINKESNRNISLFVGFIILFSLLLTRLLENIKEKQKRMSMSMKIADYKQNENVCSIILNVLVCLYLSMIATSYVELTTINKFDICNINIGLFSFIFTVYLFLIPIYKSEIKKMDENVFVLVKNKECEEQNLVIEKIEFLQSEAYFLRKSFNKLLENIILNGGIFALSISLTYIGNFPYIIQLLIATSFYSVQNIIKVLLNLKNFNIYNLKKYEEKAKKEVDDLDSHY